MRETQILRGLHKARAQIKQSGAKYAVGMVPRRPYQEFQTTQITDAPSIAPSSSPPPQAFADGMVPARPATGFRGMGQGLAAGYEKYVNQPVGNALGATLGPKMARVPAMNPVAAPAPVQAPAAAPAPAPTDAGLGSVQNAVGAMRAHQQELNNLSTGTAYMHGPGTGTSDSIHNVSLSKGEAVLPAKTVAKVGAGNIARLIQDTNDGIAPKGLRAGGKYEDGLLPKIDPNMLPPKTPQAPVGQQFLDPKLQVPGGGTPSTQGPTYSVTPEAQAMKDAATSRLQTPSVGTPAAAPVTPSVAPGMPNTAETPKPTGLWGRTVQGAKDLGGKGMDFAKSAMSAPAAETTGVNRGFNAAGKYTALMSPNTMTNIPSAADDIGMALANPKSDTAEKVGSTLEAAGNVGLGYLADRVKGFVPKTAATAMNFSGTVAHRPVTAMAHGLRALWGADDPRTPLERSHASFPTGLEQSGTPMVGPMDAARSAAGMPAAPAAPANMQATPATAPQPQSPTGLSDVLNSKGSMVGNGVARYDVPGKSPLFTNVGASDNERLMSRGEVTPQNMQAADNLEARGAGLRAAQGRLDARASDEAQAAQANTPRGMLLSQIQRGLSSGGSLTRAGAGALQGLDNNDTHMQATRATLVNAQRSHDVPSGDAQLQANSRNKQLAFEIQNKVIENASEGNKFVQDYIKSAGASMGKDDKGQDVFNPAQGAALAKYIASAPRDIKTRDHGTIPMSLAAKVEPDAATAAMQQLENKHLMNEFVNSNAKASLFGVGSKNAGDVKILGVRQHDGAWTEGVNNAVPLGQNIMSHKAMPLTDSTMVDFDNGAGGKISIPYRELSKDRRHIAAFNALYGAK